MAMPVDSETLPLRVLVAEDDPMQAFVLTRTIQAAGMIVVGPITDVASGLIEIVAAVPDAAIVDFHLGDTDSTALVSALTAQAVPVLILSGRNKDALKDRFPGCLIVRKPVRPDALINTLAGLVRAKFGNDANLGQKSKES